MCSNPFRSRAVLEWFYFSNKLDREDLLRGQSSFNKGNHVPFISSLLPFPVAAILLYGNTAARKRLAIWSTAGGVYDSSALQQRLEYVH